MATHYLPMYDQEFSAVREHRKRYVFLLNDRNFQSGDVLAFLEHEYVHGTPTGEVEYRTVDHVARGPKYRIPVGYCIMQFALNEQVQPESTLEVG